MLKSLAIAGVSAALVIGSIAVAQAATDNGSMNNGQAPVAQVPNDPNTANNPSNPNGAANAPNATQNSTDTSATTGERG